MAKEKRKHEYPDNFKGYFGYAAMNTMNVVTAALVANYLSVFLTDYAGIDSSWSTMIATIILLVGRVVDAIDDPIQGWIMDSAKVTKNGKYMINIFVNL